MLNLEMLKMDISNRAKSIYEEVYAQIETTDSKKSERGILDFKVVRDNEINGQAWRENGIDHIEINDGVIEQYCRYFEETNKYFINCVIAKLLPEKDQEEIEKFSAEGVYYEGEKAVIFDSKNIVEQRTILMQIFVSRFILTHELGHLFNGHCDYLNVVEKGNSIIKMHYGESESVDNPKVRRTLEMDADAFATTQSLFHLLFLYGDFDNQVMCQFLKPIELFYWWAFAVRSHFLVCEDTFADTLSYSDKMCHLPSNARWFMVYMIVMDFCETAMNPGYIDVEKAKELFIEGSKEAECVFNEIKYTNYRGAENILENMSFKHYYSEVNEYWEEIVSTLKLYSRAPLYGE